MSATTAQAINTDARARVISLRWIINGREDLVWFIGSVVTSYALFALYVSGILPLIPMVAAWAILIDAPSLLDLFGYGCPHKVDHVERFPAINRHSVRHG